MSNTKTSKTRLKTSNTVKNSFAQEPLSTCTFYHYQPLPKIQLDLLKKKFLEFETAQHIRGLILLSYEGINATLTGPLPCLKNFINFIQQQISFSIQARWQTTTLWGFKKLRIKIKNEIVQTGQKNLPIPPDTTRLSPSQWNTAIEKENSVLLDIRNDYEVQIGQFEKAQQLKLKKFKNFPQKIQQSKIAKDANILIYCTGGIRCEKALSEMKKQGFQNVRQLKGGILNYLSQFPNKHFKGDCFVFDHRVSLNQQLQPSYNYKLCPHCGQPGRKKIQCRHCQEECTVCALCHDKKLFYQTCSKNCAYHYEKGHRCKTKKKQIPSPNSLR